MKKVNEIIKEYLSTLEARTYRDFLAESLCANHDIPGKEIKRMVNEIADHFFNTDNYDEAIKIADRLNPLNAFENIDLEPLMSKMKLDNRELCYRACREFMAFMHPSKKRRIPLHIKNIPTNKRSQLKYGQGNLLL